MRFVEYGTDKNDVIILLHGGGLAPWNYYEEAELLKDKYHVILPMLDGHNGSDHRFTTIEENAQSVITFIDEKFTGNVLLIGGLSLGGQILVEMLSQRKDICKYALIESALVLPMGMTAALVKPAFSLCYPLVSKRWFAKLQFQSLHIKPSLFDEYYRDSAAITKENLTAFLTANSKYKVKDSLADCRAQSLILVGSKEAGIMKKSAVTLHRIIPNSDMEIMQGYCHGDLSINHAKLYAEKIVDLMTCRKKFRT